MILEYIDNLLQEIKAVEKTSKNIGSAMGSIAGKKGEKFGKAAGKDFAKMYTSPVAITKDIKNKKYKKALGKTVYYGTRLGVAGAALNAPGSGIPADIVADRLLRKLGARKLAGVKD
jgi:hypothetical protein